MDSRMLIPVLRSKDFAYHIARTASSATAIRIFLQSSDSKN